MWDDDYDHEPMTLLEKAFLWSVVIVGYILQGLIWAWIGYQLAS